MSKKFYWLKIQEHFFDSDEMIYFDSIENGDKYIVIWMKILLKCLKDKDNGEYGFLRFNDKLPYNDELLSKVLRCDLDTLRVAMKYFQDLNMVQIMDDKTIYIESVQRMIGKESDSAERMRLHRAKKTAIENNEKVKIEMSHSDDPCVTSDPNKEVNINVNKDEEEKELAFNYFWELYDFKKSKDKAKKAFTKLDKSLYPIIMNHVKEYVKTTKTAYHDDRIKKTNRQHPSTYLNSKTWEDEIEQEKTPAAKVDKPPSY